MTKKIHTDLEIAGSLTVGGQPVGGGAVVLDDLTDVDTTTAPPTDGQALVWNATNSEWAPGIPADAPPAVPAPEVVDATQFAAVGNGAIPAPASVAADDYIIVIVGSTNPLGASMSAPSSAGLSFNNLVNTAGLRIDYAVSPDTTPRSVDITGSATSARMLIVRGVSGLVGALSASYTTTDSPTVNIPAGDGLAIATFIHTSWPQSPTVPILAGWDPYHVNLSGWNTLGVATSAVSDSAPVVFGPLSTSAAGIWGSVLFAGVAPQSSLADTDQYILAAQIFS